MTKTKLSETNSKPHRVTVPDDRPGRAYPTAIAEARGIAALEDQGPLIAGHARSRGLIVVTGNPREFCA
jgi:predicted nucleic acid-binding protein